ATTSSTPCSRSSSTTRGTSVMWAPDRIERPTASASSWITVSTICSGVWCRPVYMTSMPASRSARAMILAPRSCPSSPGLATTTRILRPFDIGGQVTVTPVKRPLLALLALAAIAAGCGGKPTPPPPHNVGIEDEVQDDRLFLYGSPEATAGVLESLGVDRVRLTAGWAVIAPDPGSRRRPKFDATDPSAYP